MPIPNSNTINTKFFYWVVVATRIKSDNGHEMIADMMVGFNALREKFTSRVRKDRPGAITVDLVGASVGPHLGPGAVGAVVLYARPGCHLCDVARDVVLAVRQQAGVQRVVLGGVSDTGGVSLVAAVQPTAGVAAGELIRDAARAVGGGGGGKGDIVTAGGKNPEGLDEALRLAEAAARA